MTAVVTKDKLITNPQLNIFAYIDNRTYIKDPRHPSLTTQQRKFVYDYDPFIKDFKFDDFPFIVINIPDIDYSKTSINGKVKNVMWKQNIIVRTLREGSGNSEINNDMGDILDDLHSMFNNETVKAELRLLNQFEFKLIQTNFDLLTYQNRTVLETQLELSFYTRITVSS